MKNFLTKILGQEFMELSGLHKFYAIYFMVSFMAVMGVCLTNLWCLLVLANFGLSVYLIRKIEFKEDLNDD